MRRRSVILIILIVVMPVALLSWAAVRITRDEQIVLRRQLQQLMEQRLEDINDGISEHFANVERDMQRITTLDDFRTESLRAVNRSEPQVLQLFVLTKTGNLLYPDQRQPLNTSERSFLSRSASMFNDKDLRSAIALAEADSDGKAVDKSGSSPDPSDVAVWNVNVEQLPGDAEFAQGWFVWYWERGLNLIYWQRRPSGHIVGAALQRARWMSDLIVQLPDTSPQDNRQSGSEFLSRIRLVNAGLETVYQWGTFETQNDAQLAPLCEVPVCAPLASWRLQCFIPEGQSAAGIGRGAYVSLFGGLIATAIALGALAMILFRDYSRDMQEASQQVSFVNQVSHELKTPLTNIRMYAELLQADLESFALADAEKPRQRLDIILSEGQRLSRLIGNVLTFARQKRRTLQPQPRRLVPDDLIRQIVDRFRPALGEEHIDIQMDCHASAAMNIDPDFVEQILGNLINNVEKYAAVDGLLRITSSIDDQTLIVDVQDAGPGIEPSKRDEIFQPFARVSSNVSYAAGTGIGLTIARELARLHGGNVVLLSSDSGCVFRVSIRSLTVSS